jgi:hypothetical protein
VTTTRTLPPKDRDTAIAEVVALLFDFEPGKPVNVRLSIARPERTPAQCRYLNGVAYALLCKHAGYERDDVSEYLCGLYFGWREKSLPGGRTEQVPIRTTTTDEDGNRDVLEGQPFWDFVDWVQRFGAKHGVVIPDPDSHYRLQRPERNAA